MAKTFHERKINIKIDECFFMHALKSKIILVSKKRMNESDTPED